jgi:hypothetical protein
MWNDTLQIVFVTIIPNVTAIYFFRILIKYETYNFTGKNCSDYCFLKP